MIIYYINDRHGIVSQRDLNLQSYINKEDIMIIFGAAIAAGVATGIVGGKLLHDSDIAYVMKDMNADLTIQMPTISYNWENHPDLVELRKMNAEAEAMMQKTNDYFKGK